ncbi:MAG: N-6 DNA methylase [Geothrix sp.]|nr:N-6 DNA methylase [Geothrix sp.]
MQKEKSTRWHARERLRDKGQFWTPPWVARPMVRFALDSGDSIYDVGVGAAAFGRALESLRPDLDLAQAYAGCEPHPEPLLEAMEQGLTGRQLAGIASVDFLSVPCLSRPMGIVSNPPYVRHHRISQADKSRLRCLADRLGLRIDGRAGLHVFFLIHALTLLHPGQRLAFIVPSDIAEGVFAPALWRWISASFRIDAVVRFAPEATPFPGVDTNPLVLFLSNLPPGEFMLQATCLEPETPAFERWVEQGLPPDGDPAFNVLRIPMVDAVARGVGRSPRADEEDALPLSRFATTLRGIATGANDFFFLTHTAARELGIADEYLLPAIGKTRDVTSDTLLPADLEELERAGKPTRLLALDGREQHLFPPSIQAYLGHGEAQGLPSRALISMRNPWYKMESRTPPPFLFSYLGRRHARFIRNEAGVVPLTGFLCVYPRWREPAFLACLWKALNHPGTLQGLVQVGKTYGGGAIKVEPRALARLPIPMSVIRDSGLADWLSSDSPGRPTPLQRALFDVAL